jgi:HD superfamily phosphohydrolase
MQAGSVPDCLIEIYRILDERILPVLLPIKPHQKYQEKVIHDNLMESCYFEGWEIAFLDTPLLQRLRHIHQLGTAFLTYPSAIHTRFSHTLGVTTLAGDLYENLRWKKHLAQLDEKRWKNEKATVRMAGLLHDIGHTFFSHCSEKVVEPFWRKICSDSKLFEKETEPKAHEFIAYLIITSEYFKNYWTNVIKPDSYDISIDLQDVASIIVGTLISKDKAYLTEIIYGHYDVDKLEYLNRDAKTAGLPIAYDKARYFQKIDILEKDGKASLVMGQGGIQCVEQLALGKIMLFPYVYQHHKVLTTDAIIQDIIQKLLEKECILKNINIPHPLDMLLFTDSDILAYSVKSDDDDLNLMLRQIKSRTLPKRAFVFHREYLEESGNDGNNIEQQNITGFLKQIDNPNNLKELRKEITEKISLAIKRKLNYHEVLITRPGFFRGLFSMNSAPIITKSNKCVPVGKLWLLSGWSDAHENKTDYVYFHVPSDICAIAYKIIAQYLKEKYNFIFQDERVLEHCKLNTEDNL